MDSIIFRGKALTLVEYLQLFQANIISKAEMRDMLGLSAEEER